MNDNGKPTVEPIPYNPYDWSRDRPKDVERLNQDDREEITALLMGRTVTKVDGEHLALDDGTVIRAIGGQGGCSCGAGDYDLSVLNGVDNVITRVEFDYRPADDYTPYDVDPSEVGFYRIFVYADAQQINLMQFDGDDGNGYYGTGYEILVRRPSSKEGMA